MSKKRLFTIAAVIGLVILVAAGSWVAGTTIQSPAEVAARTAPPRPSRRPFWCRLKSGCYRLIL
jgi:hypothetical protein